MITQSKQIAHHIFPDPTGISQLTHLSYVDKISQIDNSGNLISWSSALQSYPSLQGIASIEGNTPYIIDSNSSAQYPYVLYPDQGGVASDSDLAAVSGTLEANLFGKILEGDAIERNFAEAIYEFAYDSSGNLSSDITNNFNSLTTRVDEEVAKDTFSVTAPSAGAYTFSGAGTSSNLNPIVTLTRGKTYYFDVNAVGHPFWIKTARGTHSASADPVPNEYSGGVSNNGTASGIVTFQVPMNAPQTLYYQCANHAPMYGKINVGSASSGTGGGSTAGKGLILSGDGAINLEDPAADYALLGSGVYFSDRPEDFTEANHIAQNDRMALYHSSQGRFRYTTLLGFLNSAYLHQINQQLRPTHIDGGAANTFGPFASSEVITLPTTPQNLTLSAIDGGIVVNWGLVNSATTYEVQWSTTQGDQAVWTEATGQTETSYTIQGLTNTVTYYVRVLARNSMGPSPFTQTLNATPTAGASPDPSLAAPTSVAATNGNAESVLSWTAPTLSTGVTISGYRIQYGETSGFPSNATSVDALPTDSTYTQTGLLNGTEYSFHIAAISSDGSVGTFSSTATATPIFVQEEILYSTTLPTTPFSTYFSGSSPVITLTVATQDTLYSFIDPPSGFQGNPTDLTVIVLYDSEDSTQFGQINWDNGYVNSLSEDNKRVKLVRTDGKTYSFALDPTKDYYTPSDTGYDAYLIADTAV